MSSVQQNPWRICVYHGVQSLMFPAAIFPLFWTIWLSFTNFRANRPNAEVVWLGIDNYRRVLGNEAIWENMRATAHFLVSSIALQLVLSHLWLAYFRYGPMEWLWRAITYWHWPAFRRESAPALARGAAA